MDAQEAAAACAMLDCIYAASMTTKIPVMFIGTTCRRPLAVKIAFWSGHGNRTDRPGPKNRKFNGGYPGCKARELRGRRDRCGESLWLGP